MIAQCSMPTHAGSYTEHPICTNEYPDLHFSLLNLRYDTLAMGMMIGDFSESPLYFQ